MKLHLFKGLDEGGERGILPLRQPYHSTFPLVQIVDPLPELPRRLPRKPPPHMASLFRILTELETTAIRAQEARGPMPASPALPAGRGAGRVSKGCAVGHPRKRLGRKRRRG